MRGGRRKSAQEIRHDSLGSSGHGALAHHPEVVQSKNFDSLTYITDESDVWRASVATDHYRHRGEFWNEGKHKTAQRYVIIFLTGTVQVGGTNLALANCSCCWLKFRHSAMHKLTFPRSPSCL